ncbi:MAG: hypothetical protein PHV06_08170, partial [bacterium]|nr:hypothetical protein [bacterium]
RSVRLKITDDGIFHPLTRDLVSVNIRNIPELTSTTEFINIKPGARVLATDSSVKLENKYQPIWIESNYGLGNVISIGFSGFWQWQLSQAYPEPENNFWVRTVERISRYLINEGDIKNVAILPLPSTVLSEKSFTIQVRVLDEVFMPVSNPKITLILRGSGVEQQISLIEKDKPKGIWEAPAKITDPGEYKLELKAEIDNKEIGKDSSEFNVEEYNLEFENKSLNEDLLKSLAYSTNGRYIPNLNKEDISGLLRDYSSVENRPVIKRIWANFPFLILIVLLLGVEWFLRKRFGLS